jgi:hypothetical protein
MLCIDTKSGLLTSLTSARLTRREAISSNAKPPVNLLTNGDPIPIPAEMMGYPIMIPAQVWMPQIYPQAVRGSGWDRMF